MIKWTRKLDHVNEKILIMVGEEQIVSYLIDDAFRLENAYQTVLDIMEGIDYNLTLIDLTETIEEVCPYLFPEYFFELIRVIASSLFTPLKFRASLASCVALFFFVA